MVALNSSQDSFRSLACGIFALGLLAYADVRAQNNANVPPPIEQQTADCAATTYASDAEVCSDESLSALDKQLRQLLPLSKNDPVLAIERQTEWFKRSRMCAFRTEHTACLRAAYRERIAIVRAANGFQIGSASWVPLKCRGKTLASAALGHGVVAVRTDGRILLSLAATELANWRPFLALSRNKTSSRLSWADGAVLKCGPLPGLPDG